MKQMKQCFKTFAFFFILFIISFSAKSQSPFITRWNLTAPSFIYPGIGKDYTIEWERVDNPQVKGIINGAGSQQVVQIPSDGEYYIKAYKGSGSLTGFSGGNDRYTRLLAIEQWGSVQWTKLDRSFNTCNNMDVTATDVPDLSQVSSLSGMFLNCPKLVGNASFGRWNTANIRDMSLMFSGAPLFNQDISSWNTEKVTTMSGMFQGAKAFNQPIGSWNTQWVESMEAMFYGAEQFNQPIGNWNTGNATIMTGMFTNAKAFNQPIGNWNMEHVVSIENMFLNAVKFNQPLNNWNTGNLTRMYGAFSKDSAFNQSIGNWTLQSLYDKRILGVFNGTAVDCENYAATLSGWANNPLTPDGITLDAAGLSYSAAAIPIRQKLINEKGWTINNDQYTAVCGVLPVTFGTVTAFLKNNQLTVNWETLSETACDRFIVQTSVDGKNFTDIGTLKSKSADGNSSEVLSYNFESPVLPITAAFSAILLTSCLYTRKRKALLVLIFSTIIALAWSCNRNSAELATNANNYKFIRIVQIDKDSSLHYSKVISIIEK